MLIVTGACLSGVDLTDADLRGRRPPRPPRSTEAVAAARLEKAGRAWDGALAVIDETRKNQAQAPGLAEPAKKALATLDREWDGLAAHRSYPLVSLDNNVAEERSGPGRDPEERPRLP